MSAYGLLMRDFPAGIALLGLVAALAATISTTSNAHMGITSTLARDIYQRFIRPNATPEAVLQTSRILTLLSGIVIWLLCFYPGGPYFLLGVSCAMLGPTAFVFLLGHRWTYITSAGAFWSTLVGAVAMLVYEILKLTGVPVGSVHTVIIGTVITLPTVLGVSFFTQQKPDGTLAGDQSHTVALSPDQQRLLRLIRTGYTTMVELSDFMALHAVGCHRLITELERIGLIQRWGSRGLDFFTFALTAKGDAHLSQFPNSPAGFVTQDADSRTVLEQLKHEAKNLQTLSTTTGMAPSMLSVVVNRLDQLGYVSGSGIWQRTITLSEKGRVLVSP